MCLGLAKQLRQLVLLRFWRALAAVSRGNCRATWVRLHAIVKSV